MSDLAEHRRTKSDAPIDVLLASCEWQPLVTFMAAWFRTPISSTTGVSSSELDRLERKFGRKIPAALREWYRLIGAHESMTDETAQDFEMPLRRVGESKRWLVIFGENQECWHCGILNEHCRLPDPPIYFESFAFDPVEDAGYARANLVEGKFIRVTDTLTEFVFGMALRNVVFRLDPSPFMNPGVCGATFDFDANPIKAGEPFNLSVVREQMNLRKILDFPVGFNPEFNGADVVLIDGWGFTAHTPTVFDSVARAVRDAGGRLARTWRAE
jgi:hypothetical protein